MHDWDALIPPLAAAGYTAYAPDLLGHGDSPKPPIPTYQMDWLVNHFIAWLNGLTLPQAPVIVGHSLGGYVALEYARRFPTRTRGLVRSRRMRASASFIRSPRFSTMLPSRLPLHNAIRGITKSSLPAWSSRNRARRSLMCADYSAMVRLSMSLG